MSIRSNALHRVTLVTTGVLLTEAVTSDGYEFAPINPSRAYDALVVRLAPVLKTIFNFEYPFTEALRSRFDSTDPMGLIASPWFQAPTAEQAKEAQEQTLLRLLTFAEFVRNGKGRPHSFVIERLLPAEIAPAVQIAPVRLPYKGNQLRGMENEIGAFVDNYAERLRNRPELAAIFEAFVDAREEPRLNISIARYWAVLENLASRWRAMGGVPPEGLPPINWKGSPAATHTKLYLVWSYCHLPHHIPVHGQGGMLPLSDQLRASYMLRNQTMHGPEVNKNGEAERALSDEYQAQTFPHEWFGLRFLCESAIRCELLPVPWTAT